MPVTMSPFHNSGLDTEGTIKKLMDVERRPIIRQQNEIKILNIQNATWDELRTQLKKLDTIISELYGFNRVFKKRKVYSENEEFLKATVLDNTTKGDHAIEINRLAEAHKVITDKVISDKKLPGTLFTIMIGDEKIDIKGFKKGGTINKLAEVLQTETDKLLKVQKINLDKNNVILALESRKTGKQQRIRILDKGGESDKLFKELGLLRFEKPISLAFDFNNKKPANLSFYEKGRKNSPALLLPPGSRSSLSINQEVEQGSLELFYKTVKPEENEISGSRVVHKSIRPVNVKELTIYGADMVMSDTQKEPAKEVKQGAFIEVIGPSSNTIRIDLSAKQDWESLKNELKNLTSIVRIDFINNSQANFLVDDLKITDKKEKAKKFKNVVQEPSDAELKVNGIPMTRDRNKDLNDIIDGVTLNLLKISKDPLKIEVKEDSEKIETTLADFIKQYNLVLEYITAVSRSSKKGKPGERGEDNGILSGDISIMNLHSKLRSTVVNSYETSFKNKLSMLKQIGISTGDWHTKWDSIKKGLLKFDEEHFGGALLLFGDRISELFGYDSNRDKIIDTGVGFSLNNVIKPYVQGSGVIVGKVRLINNTIDLKQKTLKRKEGKLEKIEKDLRIKFLNMEKHLDGLKQNQNQLDNSMKSLPSGGGKKD